MVRIGIVGCGTIGTAIAQAITSGRIPATLSGVYSRTASRAADLVRSLTTPTAVLSLDKLVAASDLVAEAATGTALAEIVPPCLTQGVDVYVLSVGGLIGHEEWFRDAASRGVRILIASGAIAGLDGIRGAAVGRIDSVTLTTRKPPRGLAGAPYVTARGLDLDALTEETLIFEGTAREACRGFPTNVNVSAAVSFAGIGPDLTRVRIFVVPNGRFNQHRIEVRGECGRLSIEVENVPSATNPRTGVLSIQSSIAALTEYAQAWRPR